MITFRDDTGQRCYQFLLPDIFECGIRIRIFLLCLCRWKDLKESFSNLTQMM